MEKLLLLVYSIGILVRVYLSLSDFSSSIADRVEVSTPLNSWKRGLDLLLVLLYLKGCYQKGLLCLDSQSEIRVEGSYFFEMRLTINLNVYVLPLNILYIINLTCLFAIFFVYLFNGIFGTTLVCRTNGQAK